MTLPEHEYPYWLSEVVAYVGGIWHTLTGIPNAQYYLRMLKGAASFNDVLGKREDTLASTERMAPVAAGPCSESLEQTGAAELNNVIQALLDHQTPFAFYLADQLTDQRSAGTNMAVLLSLCRLSGGAVAVLQRLARQGGGRMTSFDTGAYDGTGCLRSAPALAEQHEVGCSGDYVSGSSTSTTRGEDAEYPLLRGVGPTNFDAYELDLMQATSDVSVPPVLVLPFDTPQAAGSPPERAPLQARCTGIPVGSCHKRSVLSCGETGRLVWKYHLPDPGDLQANAIVAVRARPLAVTIERLGSIQPSMCLRADGYIIHLVSETGDGPLPYAIPVCYGIRPHLLLGVHVGAQAVLGGGQSETAAQQECMLLVVPRIDTCQIVRVAVDSTGYPTAL